MSIRHEAASLVRDGRGAENLDAIRFYLGRATRALRRMDAAKRDLEEAARIDG